MIASMHLADVGPRAALALLRRRPDPAEIAGLRWAETAVAAPLSDRVLPAPSLRVGLLAYWDGEDALDRFLAEHPVARRLAGGWHVRLEPVRAAGAWAALPEPVGDGEAMDDDEPVAVLTLGHLRLARAVPFLRTSARASGRAAGDPALLAATGLARPPRLVATFSLWRTTAAMRTFAYGAVGGAHRGAIEADRAQPFHHESMFIRFRPYAAVGLWDGREPLARPGLAAWRPPREHFRRPRQLL